MPTGDALSVFLGLLFFAGGTAVTAYSAAGTKARNLWIIAGVLFLCALALLVAPLRDRFDATWLLPKLILSAPLVSAILTALIVKNAAAAPEGVPLQGQETLLQQLSLAISKADWEDYSPSASEIPECLAVLESAFASIRKQYKYPTPKLTEIKKASLVVGVNYLRQIKPYLQAGHIEEGREAARTFLHM